MSRQILNTNFSSCTRKKERKKEHIKVFTICKRNKWKIENGKKQNTHPSILKISIGRRYVRYYVPI